MGRLAWIARLVPIAVLALGVAIHAAALAGHKLDDEPLWTDALFLAIDATLAAGLLARRRWAYRGALVLFAASTITQTYWAVRQIAHDTPQPIQIAAALTALAVTALLLATRHLHLPIQRPPRSPASHAG